MNVPFSFLGDIDGQDCAEFAGDKTRHRLGYSEL
jgi:hypothetical protein